MSALKILAFIRGTALRSTVFTYNLPQRQCLSTFQQPRNWLFVEKYGSCQPTRSSINLEFKRFKKARGRKNVTEQDDLEEEQANVDDDEEEGLSGENPMLMDELASESNDLAHLITININSLRLDTFCKTAFSLTRLKVEEAFYKGNIYVNGEKATKKSQDLNFQDEIDIVKGIDPEDHSKNLVRRAVIVKLPDKTDEQGRVKLQIKRWQELTIDALPA